MKTCPASQIEIAETATLKAMRYDVLRVTENREETTSASRPAVIAPTEEPNRTVAAMLNVSEIEKLNSVVGIRSVSQALPTVNSARTSHAGCRGCVATRPIESARTAAPARTTMAIRT